MPLPSGKATLEELVAFLDGTTDPVKLSTRLDILRDGLADTASRLSAIEKGYLEVRGRISSTEDHTGAMEQKMGAIERDRDTHQQLIDKAIAAPAVHDKHLAELDTRVRTLEGAVGAVPGHEAKAA